jgi:uncharacterized membrane-anchored protein
MASAVTTVARSTALSKVAPVTLAFWIIKICATTLGETAGDALSMTLGLGYARGTRIVLAVFALTLGMQLAVRAFRAPVYWAVVVATTTLGTTTSDYLDRTVGLGYVRSSAILFCLVLALLAAWRITAGSIGFDRITTRTDEIFYWVTILVSNTLGTALGDFLATSVGLGFQLGALVFGALIGVTAALHRFSRAPKGALFWAAYVLTRPLGATLGDTLTKPVAEGGLALGRIVSSLGLAWAMIVLMMWTARRVPDEARP